MDYLEINENADLSPGALKLLKAIEASVQRQVTGIMPSNETVMTVVRFTPSFLSSGMWVGRLDYCLNKDPHEPGTIRCAMLEGTSGKLDTVQHLLSTRKWRAPENPKVTIVDEAKLPKAPLGRSMLVIEVDGPGWGALSNQGYSFTSFIPDIIYDKIVDVPIGSLKGVTPEIGKEVVVFGMKIGYLVGRTATTLQVATPRPPGATDKKPNLIPLTVTNNGGISGKLQWVDFDKEALLKMFEGFASEPAGLQPLPKMFGEEVLNEGTANSFDDAVQYASVNVTVNTSVADWVEFAVVSASNINSGGPLYKPEEMVTAVEEGSGITLASLQGMVSQVSAVGVPDTLIISPAAYQMLTGDMDQGFMIPKAYTTAVNATFDEYQAKQEQDLINERIQKAADEGLAIRLFDVELPFEERAA